MTGNRVHNNNNIGIDIIGFEHTAPNPSIDRARDGVVSGNTVYDITSKGNPAYRQDVDSDGIYVDGGTQVVIERNIIHDVDFGIETASEHLGDNSSHILVRNNLIYSCHTAGITIGGYDLKRGGTTDVSIVNNTLYQDDSWHTGTGEFQMQYHMRNNVFKNNIVYIGKYGTAQRSRRMDPATPTVIIDHNLYYFPAGPNAVKWAYDGKEYSSFEAYVKATGQDENSVFADPRFVSPTKQDFHLQEDSPAIGKGGVLGTIRPGSEGFGRALQNHRRQDRHRLLPDAVARIEMVREATRKRVESIWLPPRKATTTGFANTYKRTVRNTPDLYP